MKSIQINEPFFHHVYIGTAAEKAGIAAPIVNDEFIETDTGIQYRWDGVGWAVITSAGAATVTVSPASVDFTASVAANADAAVTASSGLRLMGYSVQESAVVPGAAELHIMHGATVAGGSIVVSLSVAANGSANDWFGPDGIAVPNGLSIERVSGTFDISLFYKVVP